MKCKWCEGELSQFDTDAERLIPLLAAADAQGHVAYCRTSPTYYHQYWHPVEIRLAGVMFCKHCSLPIKYYEDVSLWGVNVNGWDNGFACRASWTRHSPHIEDGGWRLLKDVLKQVVKDTA